MKKQKIIFAKLCRIPEGCYETIQYLGKDPQGKEGSIMAKEVSLQKLLDEGWEIKTSWPMGGSNISAGQRMPDPINIPFASIILLEREEP